MKMKQILCHGYLRSQNGAILTAWDCLLPMHQVSMVFSEQLSYVCSVINPLLTKLDGRILGYSFIVCLHTKKKELAMVN